MAFNGQQAGAGAPNAAWAPHSMFPPQLGASRPQATLNPANLNDLLLLEHTALPRPQAPVGHRRALSESHAFDIAAAHVFLGVPLPPHAQGGPPEDVLPLDDDEVLSLLDELEPVSGPGGGAPDVWPTALPPAWPADAALFAPPPLPRAPWHSSKVVPLPVPGAGGWDPSHASAGVHKTDMAPPAAGGAPCMPGPQSLLHPGSMCPPAMWALPHIKTQHIPPPPLPGMHHPDAAVAAAAAQPKGKGRKGAAARSAGAPRTGAGPSGISDGGNGGVASAPAPRTSWGAFGGGWTPDATAVSGGGPFGRGPLSSGGAPSGSLGLTLSAGEGEDPDAKRERRVLANRASAARSRQRKLEHVQELERSVATLQAQLEDAKRRFSTTCAARDVVLAHNEALRARALRLAEECGPGFTWQLEGD